MKLRIEDIVICLALLLSFATSLLMAIANESWATHFPPSLIAFFAAITVAALIYRFLGGSDGSEFRMGVLKVTGSAAVLFGATWLLGDRIMNETVLLRTDTQYRPALDREQATAARLKDANVRLGDTIQRLQGEVAELRAGHSGYTIDQIRRMAPDDGFVSTIRRMVANEDAPFRLTLREMPALVTLNDAMTDSNVYRICLDTQDRLFRDLETQKDRLRMRRNSSGGDTHVIDAVRGGTIAPDATVCAERGPRTFDVQITCADAARLFPDRIERCAGLKPVYQRGVTTIRGERVTLGALPPR